MSGARSIPFVEVFALVVCDETRAHAVAPGAFAAEDVVQGLGAAADPAVDFALREVIGWSVHSHLEAPFLFGGRRCLQPITEPNLLSEKGRETTALKSALSERPSTSGGTDLTTENRLAGMGECGQAREPMIAWYPPLGCLAPLAVRRLGCLVRAAVRSPSR